MPDTKISAFPAAAALTGVELMAGVQSAANVKITVDQIRTFFKLPSTYVFVNTLADLPAPVTNVITLLDYTTYYFTATVDLIGSRLVTGIGTTIIGSSPDTSRVKSTGLGALPLITAVYSFAMRDISVEAAIGVNLNAINSLQVLDWSGVRFVDCNVIGTIANYGTATLNNCIALNSAELTFDGSVGTIALHGCVLDGRPTQTTVVFPASLVVSQRIRIADCSFISASGETSINASTSVNVPVEGYILDGVIFSGGSLTYLAGILYNNDKALFRNCTGITNSSVLGHLYQIDNATATVIGVMGTLVKAAGTSTAGALNQKFTHSTGRLTYSGGFTKAFFVEVSATLSSTNNQLIRIVIAKNGTPVPDTAAHITTSASGSAENITSITAVLLAPTDYVELWVTNDSAATNVTIEDLSMLIKSAE